jgi:hypothetical protein
MVDVKARWAAWGLGLGLGLTGGCGDGEGVAPATRRLSFDPAGLDFGLVAANELVEREVELFLQGTGSTRLLEFGDGTGRFQLVSPSGVPLRGSVLQLGRTPAVVRFLPRNPGPVDVSLVVATDEITAQLPAVAEVDRVELDDVDVEPRTLDFGLLLTGEAVTRSVQVRNHGRVDLQLGAGSDVPEVTWLGSTQRRVAPQGEVRLEVRWQPSAAGTLGGEVELDVSGARLALPVSGEAQRSGDVTCPAELDFGRVARGEARTLSFTCSAVDGPIRLAEARIEPSTDRDFDVVAVSQPTTPGDRIEGQVRFRPVGLPGVRQAEVRVATTHGPMVAIPLRARTDPPPEGAGDLSVRLTWDTSFTDLDLHLVRAGGNPYEPGEDCYFGEKNPAWGGSGFEDDPFLDRDATEGFGPELINLRTAADDRYDVYVQYHDYDPVAGEQPTEAEVTVWLQGAPEVVSRGLTACGRMWHVGRIAVDGGFTFVPVGTLEDFRSFAADRCRP